MATSSIEFKQIHLELVKKECLEKYVEIINQMGNVFAGTKEEFEHYHDTEDGKLFEIEMDDTALVGAIYVISKVNRIIATEVALLDPGFYDNARFEMKDEDITQIKNITCINFCTEIILSDIFIGNTFRDIYEYSLNTCDITHDFCADYYAYDVETREMPCCLDDILAFDEKLFLFGNRRDFIETCARRSVAIYVVSINDEVTGFGMLSKPVAGKRLFGPVYAANDRSSEDLLYCFFNYLTFNPSVEEIVAFTPGESLGHKVLPLSCFQRRNPLKVWIRKSTAECDDVSNKVLAMGSLLFDIY